MNDKRILVVDDSRIVVSNLSVILEDAGYSVMTAFSGEEALALCRREGLPHVAIVDLNMPPRMSGYAFCLQVHQFSDLPIIILVNDRDDIHDITGYQFYVEDHIVKPVEKKNVLAITDRAFSNRGQYTYPLGQKIWVNQSLQIELVNRLATIDGRVVSLTPIEVKLLYVLMKFAGETVTTNYLLRRIWPRDHASEERLHAHVYRLRKKIEPNPKEPKYIISRWSEGYVFPAPQVVANGEG